MSSEACSLAGSRTIKTLIIAPHLAYGTCTTNEFYGHATILRRYVGVFDHRLPLLGRLQHGWQPGPGILVDEFSKKATSLIWSARNKEMATSMGLPAISIGSPVFYLDKQPPCPNPKGIIAAPQHSTAIVSLEEEMVFWGHYCKWLLDFARTHGLSPITMCLHANEYERKNICSQIEGYGIEVTWAGHVFNNAGFLPALLARFSHYEVVTSNIMSTAIVYGSLSGARVIVGGPIPVVKFSSDFSESDFDYTTAATKRSWIEENFPEFVSDSMDISKQRKTALFELGEEFVYTKTELWKVIQLTVPDHGWVTALHNLTRPEVITS